MNGSDMFDQLSENIEVRIRMDAEADAVLVLDSVVGGTTSGGVRISADVSDEEVHALAREMTLKYAFFGLCRGGAKCGIRMPADLSGERRAKVLREFGRHLAPVISSGLYYPGMDMNCSFQDLQDIYLGAGQRVSVKTDTAYYTAMSVAQVMAAVATHAGSDRRLSYSIAGLGRVGWHLLRMLDPGQFKIVGFSTVHGGRYQDSGYDAQDIARKYEQYGDAFVRHIDEGILADKEGIFARPVDIFLPAARTNSIHSGNVDALQTRYVVAIANKPFTSDALAVLEQRGIACFPGYVCNGGGVFASGLKDSGFADERIAAFCAGPYRKLMEQMLIKASSGPKTLHEIAKDLAFASHRRLRFEKNSIINRGLHKLGRHFDFAGRMLRADMLRRLENQMRDHDHAIQSI